MEKAASKRRNTTTTISEWSAKDDLMAKNNTKVSKVKKESQTRPRSVE